MGSIFGLLGLVFEIWMIVDAVRNGEHWAWIIAMFFFPGIAPLVYLFVVKIPRDRGGGAIRPVQHGMSRRKMLKEAESKVRTVGLPAHHYDLANLYYEAGRYDEAEVEYRKVLEAEPDHLVAAYKLGRILYFKGRAAEAAGLLERVVAREPGHDFGEALTVLGQSYEALGREEEALEAYQEGLGQGGGTKTSLLYARLLARKGEVEKVRRLLERLIAEADTLPRWKAREDREWIRRARELLKEL